MRTNLLDKLFPPLPDDLDTKSLGVSLTPVQESFIQFLQDSDDGRQMLSCANEKTPSFFQPPLESEPQPSGHGRPGGESGRKIREHDEPMQTDLDRSED